MQIVSKHETTGHFLSPTSHGDHPASSIRLLTLLLDCSMSLSPLHTSFAPQNNTIYLFWDLHPATLKVLPSLSKHRPPESHDTKTLPLHFCRHHGGTVDLSPPLAVWTSVPVSEAILLSIHYSCLFSCLIFSLSTIVCPLKRLSPLSLTHSHQPWSLILGFWSELTSMGSCFKSWVSG